MIELVLFDIDGTLIQTGGAGVKAFARAFQSTFGIENATKAIQFAGRTDTGLAREIFLRAGINPNPGDFQRFFDDYVFWLDAYLHQLDGRICPGVTEFIDAWKAVSPAPALGLLTGNVRLGAEIKLRHFNLWEHFVVGAFADDHENRNHISAIAHRRGAALLGRELDPEGILVIGDTPLDIECAKAIGARSVAVATGSFSLADLNRHSPDWAVASLEEITPEQILRGPGRAGGRQKKLR